MSLPLIAYGVSTYSCCKQIVWFGFMLLGRQVHNASFLSRPIPPLWKNLKIWQHLSNFREWGAQQEGRNDYFLHLLLMGDLSCHHPYRQYGAWAACCWQALHSLFTLPAGCLCDILVYRTTTDFPGVHSHLQSYVNLNVTPLFRGRQSSEAPRTSSMSLSCLHLNLDSGVPELADSLTSLILSFLVHTAEWSLP